MELPARKRREHQHLTDNELASELTTSLQHFLGSTHANVKVERGDLGTRKMIRLFMWSRTALGDAKFRRVQDKLKRWLADGASQYLDIVYEVIYAAELEPSF